MTPAPLTSEKIGLFIRQWIPSCLPLSHSATVILRHGIHLPSPCTQVLPWSEFEDVARKMWKFGLIQMALEYPFSLAPSEVMDPLLEDPDKFYHHCHVDRRETIIKLYHEDAVFHSRYNEVMERLIDGYVLA